jgi:hypothetical protein
VLFRTGRIAEIQNTTISDQVTFQWFRDPGTSFEGFTFASGSQPTTQAGILIIQDNSSLFGVQPGTVYFYGSEEKDFGAGFTALVYRIFGSLRGAQQLDATDVIDVTSGTGMNTLTGLWTPIGPPTGLRNNNYLLSTTSGTTPTSVLGNDGVSLTLSDRRYQASEYEVNFVGASPESGVSTLDAVELLYEDDAGDDFTVKAREPLIYRNVNVQTFLTLTGWSEAEFTNVFGFDPSTKAFVGLLVTITGYLVRAISIATTVARVAIAIKKEIDETTEQFISRLQLDNATMMELRSGVHLGHELRLTKNFVAARKGINEGA